VRDNFKDIDQATSYAEHRPKYPPTVLEKILGYFSSSGVDKINKLAVDVGCGSGQGTLPLCQHFESVIGLDTSEAQIEQARLKVGQDQSNLIFKVGHAEDLSFLEDDSVDLITVATALHWFEVEKFCFESFRVLRPGGVLAAYSYGYGSYSLDNGQNIDDLAQEILSLMRDVADPHVVHVYDHYAQIFPIFQKIFPHALRDDSVTLNTKFSIEGIQGLMKSVSMYKRAVQACPDKSDPAERVRDHLMRLYNNAPPQDAVTCSNAVFIVMGRK